LGAEKVLQNFLLSSSVLAPDARPPGAVEQIEHMMRVGQRGIAGRHAKQDFYLQRDGQTEDDQVMGVVYRQATPGTSDLLEVPQVAGLVEQHSSDDDFPTHAQKNLLEIQHHSKPDKDAIMWSNSIRNGSFTISVLAMCFHASKGCEILTLDLAMSIPHSTEKNGRSSRSREPVSGIDGNGSNGHSERLAGILGWHGLVHD
jgi:hypothetical protein